MLDQLMLPLTKFTEFGISYKRATELVLKHGISVVIGPGKGQPKLVYAPDLVNAHYLESEGIDYARERARLTKVQAEIAELDRDAKRGELIPREEIEDEVARCISNCKSRFLGLPTKAAPVVIGMSESEAQATLKEMVYEALNELSAMPEAKNEATK